MTPPPGMDDFDDVYDDYWLEPRSPPQSYHDDWAWALRSFPSSSASSVCSPQEPPVSPLPSPPPSSRASSAGRSANPPVRHRLDVPEAVGDPTRPVAAFVQGRPRGHHAPINIQRRADAFLRALNCVAQVGHTGLADRLTGLCRVTRVDDNLTDAVARHKVGAGQRTRLMYAARVVAVDRVLFLLAHAAHPDITDARGSTALIWAARGYGPQVVTTIAALCSAGANVNAATNLGCTAIMTAGIRELPDAMRELYDHGASLTARNIYNKPVRGYCWGNMRRVFDCLEEHGTARRPAPPFPWTRPCHCHAVGQL